MRRIWRRTAVVIVPALLGAAVLLAAPRPKEAEEGELLTKEQVLNLLKEKSELTWDRGTIRLKVKKVDREVLEGITLEVHEAGKVVKTLSGKSAKIQIDREKSILFLHVDEGKVNGDDFEFEFQGQEFELAAPRQTKSRSK